MFKDRFEAGEKLAEKLKELLPAESLAGGVVLGIPRGGVAVGNRISRILKLPLDCLITKKIPAPGNEELAIGAVGDGGIVVWEEALIKRLSIPLEYREDIVKDKINELEKKKTDFSRDQKNLEVKDRVVIIADDGVATGSTMKVAIAVIRNLSPKKIIIAVPVISLEAMEEIKKLADTVICLHSPEVFFSIDQFYLDFTQLPDEAVVSLLKEQEKI